MPNTCSFCGDLSHNIRRCNHPHINVNYNNIKIIFMDLLTQPLNNVQRKIQFTSCLSQRFNVRELKAVAVKYIRIQAFLTKAAFIEKLWFYFLVHIHPANPEEVEEEEENPVFWVIDRTPNPIQLDLIETFRHLEYNNNQYESAADEFIPFLPNNLLPQFEAESKKFDIIPLLFCKETKEELEILSECSICYETTKLEESVILNCDHKFCHECVKKTLIKCSSRNKPSCALCREPMAVFIIKNQNIYESVSELCNLD